MIAILTALLLTIATHAEATCDKLCDRDWWKTATAAHLNRPGFTGDCLVLLKRLYLARSGLHSMPPLPQLV